MFEAFQERPQYWDDMPLHRSPAMSRGGANRDWIRAWQRVAQRFPTLERAEAYARRILAQRPGCPVHINECGLGRNNRIAIVSRDALGRTWTDLQTWEPLL